MKLGYLLIPTSLLACWLLMGCATQPLVESTNPAPPVVDPPAVVKKPATRAFTIDELYSLLTAEIAGSRERYDIALNNYVQQARGTHDPQVAERATMIARYLKKNDIAMEMALLWAEAAPESSEAIANASMTLMQNDRQLEAFDMSRRLLERGEETLFQNIAASATDLTDVEREALLQRYQSLLETYPDNEQLLVGTGLLLQQQGSYAAAQEYSQAALKINSHSIPASILEASLLHQLDRDDEAIAKMAELLEQYPDNLRLRLQYARILAHHDLGEAQQQFEILVKQSPNDADLLLSLGIIAMERKDIETAVQAFEQLLDQDQHLATAHYYLGRIAESRADTEAALMHYLQVDEGNDFMAATTSLLNLMISHGDLLSATEHMQRTINRFPELAVNLSLLHAQTLIRYQYLDAAETVLNKALARDEASAGNIDLLFARAMLSEQRGDIAATERDLRYILQQEPNNPTALNSLGYILTNRTQRYDDAAVLLEQAIALKPDDPAILDSVGWLRYHTGNYPEALQYLRRAFELYPDAEIAAHLGEVLWVIGEREAAQHVWDTALKLTPDSEVILSTMQRLKAVQE